MSEQSLYRGLDVDIDETERLLIGANNLAWCSEWANIELERKIQAARLALQKIWEFS